MFIICVNVLCEKEYVCLYVCVRVYVLVAFGCLWHKPVN